MIYIINIAECFETNRAKRNIWLYRKLESAGKSVKIISSNFDHGLKKHFKSTNSNQILIPVLSYSSHISLLRLLNHIWFSFAVFFICLLNLRLKAILVSSIPSELAFSIAVLKLIRPRLKIVLDVRDTWPESLPNQYKEFWYSKIFITYCNYLNSFSFSRFNDALVANPDFSPYVNKFRESYVLVPLGYDKVRFSSDINCNRTGSVYIGNFNASFDVKLLSDFIKLGENTVFIGGGPLEYEYRTKFPCSQFIGFLSYQDVAGNLARFEYGLLPISGSATLPNKVFDYVAAGLKVITNSEHCAAMWSKGRFVTLPCGLYLVEPASFDRELLLSYDEVAGLMEERLRW